MFSPSLYEFFSSSGGVSLESLSLMNDWIFVRDRNCWKPSLSWFYFSRVERFLLPLSTSAFLSVVLLRTSLLWTHFSRSAFTFASNSQQFVGPHVMYSNPQEFSTLTLSVPLLPCCSWSTWVFAFINNCLLVLGTLALFVFTFALL